MNCPKCNKEMEEGTVSYMGVQGFPQMMCNFVSKAEKSKGFFKRDTQTKIILSGNEENAYYCGECDMIISMIK